MADGTVQVPQSFLGGALIDNSRLTVGGNEVYRQRVEVYSGETLPVSGPLTDTQLRASNVAVGIGDGANLDAFSRLRTSHPTGLFSAQCQYDHDPLLFETGVTGSGTAPAHSASTRMVTLACTGTGTSFIQSYEYIPYQAGKSQLIFCTGVIGAAVASTVTEFGLFDAANGLFIRQASDGTISAVRRTSTSGSVVDNVIAQADWNLDKLDGTGASGITLDVTDTQILVIDAQFLAMGRVRFGFDIGGQIVYCHQSLHSNVIQVPYMQTLTLPVQMLLTSTGGTKNTTRFKCASVSSEGGFADDIGYSFSTPEGTVTAASGARTHILSLRPLTTFNSLANRTRLRLTSVEIFVTGNTPIFWELCVGSTFSVAPTFASVNATYSAYQYGTGGTLTAGTLAIASGYVAATNQNKTAVSREISARYPITLDRAGAVRALGTLSLLVTGIGGTSATRASLNFTEIR